MFGFLKRKNTDRKLEEKNCVSEQNCVNNTKDLKKTGDFSEIVKSLLNFRKYSDVKGLEDFSIQCEKIADRLEAPLTIMVMGEFSTGKSSLINAIVGQEIAVVNATPTTAVITVLTFGEKEKVLVHYNNGFVDEFDTKEFTKLTAMSKNSQFNNLHSTIKYVERFMPLDILKDISIIDSPGLNDTNKEHVDATKEFTDNADAVLWITSVEQAGKRSEIDSMKMLSSRLKPILIVNKMDMVDEEEEDPNEILKKIKGQLGEMVQSVIGISAKIALQGKIEGNDNKYEVSNFNELILYLRMFVLPNKYSIKLNTFFDEFGSLICNEYARNIKGLLRYYKAGINVDQIKYQLLLDKLLKWQNDLEKVISIVQKKLDSMCIQNNASALFFKGVLYDEGITVMQSNNQARKYYEQAKELHHNDATVFLTSIYKESGENELLVSTLKDLVSVGNCRAIYGSVYGYLEMEQYDEVHRFLMQASQIDDNVADRDFWLGQMYENGWGCEVDLTKSVELYESAAANGNVFAKCWLSSKYIFGEDSVHKNERKGFDLVKEAADLGNGEACYGMGMCYENGLGTDTDMDKAIYWYKIAAELDVADAYIKIGYYYLNDSNKSVDYDKAFFYFSKSAEAGDVEGQNMLGRCFQEGWGVNKNLSEAFKYYKNAAELNDNNAQRNLALMYESGDGVQKNLEEAFVWYKKAAENGNVLAYVDVANAYDSGMGVNEDQNEAFKWYKKAADENNDAWSQVKIGIYFRDGLGGLQQNDNDAFQWFYKAAEQGQVDAQFLVGENYFSGIGICQNYSEAFNWYKKAAEQGHSGAEVMLGRCYENGFGIGINEKEAVDWYKKAVDDGNGWGAYNLGIYFSNKQDNETAYNSFMCAADMGIPAAQNMVGRCFEEGWGVEKDERQAFEWFKIAADNGDEDGKNNVALCFMNGIGVKQNWKNGYHLLQHQAENGNETAIKLLQQISNDNDADDDHTLSGAAIGAGIGTFLGGPLGTAIGAAIGGWLGGSDKEKK